MLKKFINLTNMECRVFLFPDDLAIFPIHKNGSTSIINYAKKRCLPVFSNQQIKKLEKITVYLRDPDERFRSGVHTYCYLEDIPLDSKIMNKIYQGEIINNHFAPQYIWLLCLKRWFAGKILFRPHHELLNLIPNRDGPWTKKPKRWKDLTQEDINVIQTFPTERYTTYDKFLIKKYMFEEVSINKILNNDEIRNELS